MDLLRWLCSPQTLRAQPVLHGVCHLPPREKRSIRDQVQAMRHGDQKIFFKRFDDHLDDPTTPINRAPKQRQAMQSMPPIIDLPCTLIGIDPAGSFMQSGPVHAINKPHRHAINECDQSP